MRSYVYRVVIEPDEMDDGTQAFHGYCPALPGCHSWGHTPEEALARIQEAVSLYVEDLIAAGEPVPVGADIGAAAYETPAVVVNI